MATSCLEKAYLALAKNKGIFHSPLQICATQIAQQCAVLLEISRASVWVSIEDESLFHCVAKYSPAQVFNDVGMTLDEASCPGYFAAIRDARCLRIQDVGTDSRVQELVALGVVSDKVCTLLDVMLRTHGNLAGILRLEITGQQRVWNANERMFIGSLADLLSQRLIVDELTRSEGQYKSLYDYTSEGIVVFGGDRFIDVNPAACTMYGGTKDQIIGKTPIELSPEYQSDGQLSSVKALNYISACLAGTSQQFEWTHQRIDGTEFYAEITLNAVRFAGEDTLFAHLRDVTSQKLAQDHARVAREELLFRASHDSLTGLMNRDQLHRHIGKLIDSNKHSDDQKRIVLLLLDLNRFKEVNDTLGHSIGDKVLLKLADILQVSVNDAGGHLFRLGGDEFVALFDTEHCSESFSNLESIVTRSLKTSISLDDISIEMSASIGIAMYPDDGLDSHELLRCADVAMYHSKNNDATSSWYNPLNDPNDRRRLAMMVELGSAIANNELTLHFQPKVRITTGEVTGCEALIRWEHPKHGLVLPAEFIPLAEMSELIHPLSDWVISSAVEQIKQLSALGFRVPVAVNISGRNLTDIRMVDNLRKIIEAEDIDPGMLEIELTESALINHPQRAIENLQKIGKLGMRIAIDDFGTGYSSLTYLKKLPLNTLKIDGSFILDMLIDDSDSAIVDSTIDLAHHFKMTVVAEGVEDLRTMAGLAAKNCDQAQGYCIARPMPAKELHRWLQSTATIIAPCTQLAEKLPESISTV